MKVKVLFGIYAKHIDDCVNWELIKDIKSKSIKLNNYLCIIFFLIIEFVMLAGYVC